AEPTRRYDLRHVRSAAGRHAAASARPHRRRRSDLRHRRGASGDIRLQPSHRARTHHRGLRAGGRPAQRQVDGGLSMALGPDDLVLPHFAMIDVEPGMNFIARSFQDRCVAAAAGGFAGVGITHMLYEAEREAGRSDADLIAMARDHGVVVSEIESISMPGPAKRNALDDELESVLHAAEVFGAT